jgi:probable rRNA maturation factor
MPKLDLQLATAAPDLPSRTDLQQWIDAALGDLEGPAEVVIRIVDEPEGLALNRDYRGKGYATNVLSFPFHAPPPVESALLGDLVICAPVVAGEAREQGKAPIAHWAHLVVHGVLHLRGYDHQNDEEAAEMEGFEREILAGLGFPDPYANDEL